jgi:hypothetical protein
LTSVSFRKQVSDGNYGSETAEVLLEVDIADLVDTACEDEIAAALATARRLVFEELRCSPSAAVRRALAYPENVRISEPQPEAVDEDEDIADESLPY